MKNFSAFLLLLLVLAWHGVASAATPPPAGAAPAAPSLAGALNPDGTLRPGAAGSFDARQFTMQTAPDGRPVFRPRQAKGAGDFRWADGFGLPNGTNGEVRAMLRVGTDIYVGGNFTAVGNVAANYIAKWNGTTWSSLGMGAGNGVDGSVYALAATGSGEVYVGGYFTQAGGVAANRIARWNGMAWSSLGTGAGNGVNGFVNALAVAGGGEVYVGGTFTQAGGILANYIAKWNGTTWSSLGTGAGNGVNCSDVVLAVSSNGDVYVGGNFTQAGGVAANGVAKWNGTAWSSLGTGVGNGLNGIVYALAVSGNGEVYAAGAFTQAGGLAANRIAKWNGTAWSSLGTGAGNGVNSNVSALAVSGSGEVYAAGIFTQAGGAAAKYIAKWNGTAWSSLGAGVNSYVNALAVSGSGELYAGGGFTQIGGVAANGVAKWNGTTWSSLGIGAGNGINGFVNELAVSGSGEVYAGGNLTQAGGVAANYIAKWNGTTWSSLGTGASNGVNGGVYALAVSGSGEVYVGGSFTQAGGVGTTNIAKWNGTAWSSLGTGLNNVTGALALGTANQVYAGGGFGGVGDNSKASVGFAIYDPAAVSAAAPAAAVAEALGLYPNPAHGTATVRLPSGTPRRPPRPDRRTGPRRALLPRPRGRRGPARPARAAGRGVCAALRQAGPAAGGGVGQ